MQRAVRQGMKMEFSILYAKAPYYSEAGIFSTTNIKHIGAKLQAQLTDKFDISLDMRRLF